MRDAGGFKSRIRPPYPRACRKRRLNGAVCPESPYTKGRPVSVTDGHVKEPCEMSMAYSVRLHICAVKHMTVLSLHMT